MALPPTLLQFVEQHGCFSGCYGSVSDVQAFITPHQPPVPMVSVTCQDCLCNIGTLASLLPAGTRSWQLADQLSRHVRARRGYSLSVSGYHTNGPGFWFSAVYWASCDLFLIDGQRSRQLGGDLDLLMLAFKHGVLKAPVASMLNPASYTVQPLYLDLRQPMPAVATKTDLLKAPGVKPQPMAGWKKLTMAQFVAAPPPAATVAPKPAGQSVVQRCPKCGAEIRQRSLLHQTFVGCLC
jgi:hypothetical protein